MPKKDITTLAEFKRYLSAVRKAAGRKGGKTPTTKQKGFAAASPEQRTECAYKAHESFRTKRDQKLRKPSAPPND